MNKRHDQKALLNAEATEKPLTSSPTVATSPSMQQIASPTDNTPASSGTPSQTPTVFSSAQATHIAMARATIHAMAWPTTSETPDPYNLIDDALARNEIDIDHASVYRLYALFASPYLPSKFEGPLIRGDGLGSFMFAMKDFDLTSTATQKFVGNFTTPRVITETTSTPTRANTLPAASSLPGVYSIVFADRDIVPGAPRLNGRWRMDLSSPLRATLSREGKSVITCEYLISGDQILFTDLFGSFACDDNRQPANYQWSTQNRSLNLKHLSDNCGQRVRLLESYAWVKE